MEARRTPRRTTSSPALPRLWADVVLLVAFCLAARPSRSQDYFYSVEDIASGEIVERGRAGPPGRFFESLFLAPETAYRFRILEASTFRVGDASLVTPTAGRRFTVPDIGLRHSLSPDTDADGLPDEAERILGSDPENADTDGDGIPDGQELRQGLDPVEDLVGRTGVIASVDTPGYAEHVCALDDVAIIADSERGISVFNVFNGMEPVIIAQVDTPGTALAAACSGTRIAVADGPAGIAVVEASEPPAARVVHQIDLGGFALAVVAAAGTAYVGIDSGVLAIADLATGTLFERLRFGEPVEDLALAGDELYVLTASRLSVRSFAGGLEEVGSVGIPFGKTPGELGKKLFAGGGLLYIGMRGGWVVVDASDPAAPELCGDRPTAQPGVHDIAANGSGFVLPVTVGLAGGTRVVSLYDGTDPFCDPNRFLRAFDTGFPEALSLYNGLAYVAGGAGGLQVLSYEAYDRLGRAPAIELAASFPLDPAEVEEGTLARVSALVADDVQVRNVEFYRDGIKVATDGNFPFEHRFVAPLLRDEESFTLRARASDTGGNATWTPELVVRVTEDATPPRVLIVAPEPLSITGSVTGLWARFSEAIDEATLPGAFRLVSTGEDRAFGTGDDLALSGEVSFRADIRTAALALAAPLAPGRYRAVLEAGIADPAGNLLGEDFIWEFIVIAGTDRDGDGVPDDVEALLGLDPADPDTDGDGIPDGREDFDGDGLPNAGEILAGTDPRAADTDGDGIPDGEEDEDLDGLSAAVEVALGTDLDRADTDIDGWPDEAEVTAGASPLDARSTPRMLVRSGPLLRVVLPAPQGEPSAATTRRIAVTLPGDTPEGEPGALPRNTTVASPPVSVELEGP